MKNIYQTKYIRPNSNTNVVYLDLFVAEYMMAPNVNTEAGI